MSYQDLGNGVYCIDTDLYRDQLAACYLLRQGDSLAFVDTGTAHTVPKLLQVVKGLGLGVEQVDYVIPTHVHLDHSGGAGDLMALCPNARLVAHPKAAPHLIDPERLTAGATAVYGAEAFSRDFGGLTPVPEERIIVAGDGHEIDLAGRKLTFLDTPGHANHHGCVFDHATRGFFTGDTYGIAYKELYTSAGPYLFAPCTPVAFDPEAWQASLDKLLAYEPVAMYLTHFGRLEAPETLLDTLRQSIRDLASLAVAEEANGEEGRGERLYAALDRLLLEGARKHGCKQPDAELRELLRVDIDLNAQGLHVWLKRRAKAAAKLGVKG